MYYETHSNYTEVTDPWTLTVWNYIKKSCKFDQSTSILWKVLVKIAYRVYTFLMLSFVVWQFQKMTMSSTIWESFESGSDGRWIYLPWPRAAARRWRNCPTFPRMKRYEYLIYLPWLRASEGWWKNCPTFPRMKRYAYLIYCPWYTHKEHRLCVYLPSYIYWTTYQFKTVLKATYYTSQIEFQSHSDIYYDGLLIYFMPGL